MPASSMLTHTPVYLHCLSDWCKDKFTRNHQIWCDKPCIPNTNTLWQSNMTTFRSMIFPFTCPRIGKLPQLQKIQPQHWWSPGCSCQPEANTHEISLHRPWQFNNPKRKYQMFHQTTGQPILSIPNYRPQGLHQISQQLYALKKTSLNNGNVLNSSELVPPADGSAASTWSSSLQRLVRSSPADLCDFGASPSSFPVKIKQSLLPGRLT